MDEIFRRRVRGLELEQCLFFFVHLELMLRCGLPLLDCLTALSKDGDEEVASTAERIAHDLQKGFRLSEALRLQPESFDDTTAQIVEAGEQSGSLCPSLERLADNLGKSLHTRQILKSALVYPAFLLGGCVTLVMVMIYFIFPMVIAVTKGAGVEPPALTKALMSISRPSVGVGLLLLICVLVSGIAHLLRSPKYGLHFRMLLEKYTPPGKFFVSLQLLESTRQFSLLLRAGVDLLTSLRFAAQVGAKSRTLSLAYREVLMETRLGEELAISYEKQDVFPPMLCNMLAVSGESGQMTQMLDHFCRALEEDLNIRLNQWITALEPILLSVMGVVVGVLLLAAFMPIYNLVQL